MARPVEIQVEPKSLKGFRGYQKFLKSLPAQVNRAQRRSIIKTLKWGGSFVARTVAIQTGIPLKLLTKGGGKRDGVRVRYSFPKLKEIKGTAWIGGSPIKAAYVGKLKQREDEAGARAGKYFFKGGFIARMKSGHTGIFKRVGKHRLPLREETVSLQGVVPTVRAVQRFIPARYDKVFDQEFNFELNVRGRR